MHNCKVVSTITLPKNFTF